MEKVNDSSGDEEDYFYELRNFEFKFLPGLSNVNDVNRLHSIMTFK